MTLYRGSIVSIVLTACIGLGFRLAQAAPPTGEPAVKDEELIGNRADQMSRVVDKAIACLVQADAPCFRALLSKETIERETRGSDAIEKVIETRFIPYFKDFRLLTDTVATLGTHDEANNPGLAIFRTFQTSRGDEKPFVIYVIDRQGTYVVGNLLLDTTMEDVIQAERRTSQ